jgi:hypothetical protein
MRLNFIHQEIRAGTIKLVYIDSNNNTADILTKPLSLAAFEQHAVALTKGFGGKPIIAIKNIKKSKAKSAFKKRSLNTSAKSK